MPQIDANSGLELNVFLNAKEVDVDNSILPVTLIGHKDTVGTSNYATFYEDIKDSEVDDLFGFDSELAHAAKYRIKYHPSVKLNAYVLPQLTGLGAFASGDLKVSSVALEDGNIVIKSIANISDYVITIPVLTTDTVDDIATKINDAIGDADHSLFTSIPKVGNTDTCTLTSKLPGLDGNITPFQIYTLNSNGRSISGLEFDWSGFTGATLVASLSGLTSELENYNSMFALSGTYLDNPTEMTFLESLFDNDRLNNQEFSITSGIIRLAYAKTYANAIIASDIWNEIDRPLIHRVLSQLDDISGTGVSAAKTGTPEPLLSIGATLTFTAQSHVDNRSELSIIYPQNTNLAKPVDKKYNYNVAKSGIKYIYNPKPTSITQDELDILKNDYNQTVWYATNSYATTSEWKTGSTNIQFKYDAVFSTGRFLQQRLYDILKPKYENQKKSSKVISDAASDVENMINLYASDDFALLAKERIDKMKVTAIPDLVDPAKVKISFDPQITNHLGAIDVIMGVNSQF